jgi:cation-transporting ATPase 13A1
VVCLQVGITSGKKELALLLKKGADGKLVWASAYAAHTVELSFSAATVVELAQTYDLSVSGASLAAAVAQDPAFWTHMECIKVFARMSPDGKADVIKALKERGFTTLMCGDGGNDVGALKQADVGLALLSGFGNMNAESSSELHGDGNEKVATRLSANLRH